MKTSTPSALLCLLLPISLWGQQVGGEGTAARAQRFFEDYEVDARTQLPRFYREIPRGERDGTWVSSWSLEGSRAVLLRRFTPGAARPHLAVSYDGQERPVLVESVEHERAFKLRLEWNGGTTSALHWVHFDRSGVARDSLRLEVERDALGAPMLVRTARQGHAAWSASYHPRSNGLLVLCQFPSGQIREVQYYRFSTNERRLWLKERRYNEKSVQFEVPGVTWEGPALREVQGAAFLQTKGAALQAALGPDSRLDREEDFRAFFSLRYETFTDVDRESCWEDGERPAEGALLVRERNRPARVELRREHKLVCTVTLEKASAFTNANALPSAYPYEGYFDGMAYWGDYSVEELEGPQGGARAERQYRDGLLRQVRWLDSTGAVKTVRLAYYPDRSLLRASTFLGDERVDQRLFHNSQQPGPGLESVPRPWWPHLAGGF